jgi:hypothetical protein
VFTFWILLDQFPPSSRGAVATTSQAEYVSTVRQSRHDIEWFCTNSLGYGPNATLVAPTRSDTAFVLLAATTNRGEQKPLHIVIACEAVFFIVM